MTDPSPSRRRLTGRDLTHALGGTEDLVDSAVKVGLLMPAVAAVDRTRQWRHRRRAG
ncbi:hypothetical protein [Actinacidiphila glaucinigra]|uniref:hypothetical protein n=1 Tax=Actinacidiphila glaucinigra TaxID=235986 RepID=UPI0037222CA1